MKQLPFPAIPALPALLLLAALPAAAQPKQEVKPPQAQAWIDVATFSGLGLPGAGMPANPMAALGSLFGNRGARQVPFGMTAGGGSGRYVDVTLMVRARPDLAEAAQDVPAAFMSPALKLLAPKEAPAAPVRDGDDEVVPAQEPERPKGRVLLYWGCGDAVRAGQPRVLDLAQASAADLAAVFQARRATQRGAHSAAGRPHWPNASDGRAVPEGASLAGAHQFGGVGVPEGFRFTVPPAQDLMPPMDLQQAERGGAVDLSWAAQPNARAFFVAAMGARGSDEMVMWTSSELPDSGFGLIDYQTNAAVDRWLREKVLLPPTTTRCTVPKGVFGADGGAMLRAIAYGHELNLAHPPRPADPRQPWEPVWALKLRVKSVASAVLGMPSMEPPARDAEPAARKEERKPGALDILRGVLGR